MSQLGPTLLTLDDVQWADELSVALCLYLLRAAASASQPLLVVVAGRDTPAIAALDEAVRHALDSDIVVSIALQPLDRDAGLTLLRELAPDLSPADAVEVWRLAAGSPFWLHALAVRKGSGRAGRGSDAPARPHRRRRGTARSDRRRRSTSRRSRARRPPRLAHGARPRCGERPDGSRAGRPPRRRPSGDP